jgi:hypothetical protein
VPDPVLDTKDRIRAPRRNDEAIVVPARVDLAQLLATNRQTLSLPRLPEWIQVLRTRVRSEAWHLASDYANSTQHPSGASVCCDSPLLANRSLAEAADAPWIVGGHQPEWFHPGVWYKNFLIDSLAKEWSGIGMHCIVDHDLARSTSIKVPSRDVLTGRVNQRTCRLPLRSHPIWPHSDSPSSPSSPTPARPWHQTWIDPEQLDRFRCEVSDHLSSVGIEHAMVGSIVDHLKQLPTELDAARAISQARHRIEVRNGLSNLELPMSGLCSGLAWHAFLHHCLHHAEALHRVYNQSLSEYRERERITNPGQPVASLGAEGEWLELPFWMYRADSTTRQRMWVRRNGNGWSLASGGSPITAAWNVEWPADPRVSEPRWQQRVEDGLCIRPRALMTTLFLRCFLADLFVHGIGGGVYDRLTDSIIERFLCMPSPEYAVATATLWLSAREPETLRDDESIPTQEALHRESQQLRSRPETFLDRSDPAHRRLSTAHETLLASIPPRGQKRAWHHQMVGLKQQIRLAIADRRKAHEQRRQHFDAQSQERRWLRSREYSFVLFEERDIVRRFHSLLSSQPESTSPN